MAKKNGKVMAVSYRRNGRTIRAATTAQILGSQLLSPPLNRTLVAAFGGDVDSARGLKLDEAHFGELQT